jgi:maleate isomerase
MPDVVGWRAKMGTIIPSTNTVVEHDFNMLAPPGISIHAARFWIERPVLSTNEEFVDLIQQVFDNMPIAIRDVMTCKPDHLLMGMSAGTFWNGIEGSLDFERRVSEQAGITISTGSTSCKVALEALGCRRISVLTPYQPVADEQVGNYFTEVGFDVIKQRGLKCPSATAIAQVTEDDLVEVLRSLDGPDVDAIVQCGTNLSMVKLAAEAERWIGKPVIAINTATFWHGLRLMGFADQYRGFGALLEHH